ncbi:MAG: NFACT family protein [Oscillospiraceae bacterium]|nr:NFACT family protein [Oscillospiraceae bacterium]
MSLDGAFLHLVKAELMTLIGSRVDKVYQPSREEIVITLRTMRDGAKKLILSANSVSARVNLTETSFDNPQQPPMFCMLMRKHLGGGRLTDIRQDGLERIIYFDFECVNEIGDIVTNTLAAEIMGRHSNIILIRDGRVVDSIKRVTDDISSVRRVLPNIPYETPPRTERLNLLEVSPEEVWERLNGSSERLAKRLLTVLEGVSPVFTRECAYYAARDVDIPCNELTEGMRDKVLFFLSKAKKALGGTAEYTIVSELGGRKKDFCFVNIEQYSTAMLISHAESANSLLDGFFAAADRTERTKQRARDLLKLLMNSYERVSRKLELQKKELAECSEREVFRVCGDLINANIYRLEKGMTKCTLEDFYSGEPREIALDARLTPAQNAQKYYTEYRKLDTAEKMLTELIKKGGEELVYIDSVFDCVSRTENEAELAEIRRELREQGYLRGGKTDEKIKKTEPLRYVSTSGYEILVGKNNRQNDTLTLKTARASDIWLHTKEIAGSHVIIRTAEKGAPDEETILEAAELAAYHSKGRSSSQVPVDYTAVKFVKKPAGAKPGMVIFTNNRTVYVTPDEETVKRLSAGRG